MKIHCTSHGISGQPGKPCEDAWRVVQRDTSVLAALADGLGASKEGGAAARRAVDMVCDYYVVRPHAWSPRRALSEFASQINRLFFQESQLRFGSSELLCTLSVVAFEGDRLFGLNVGDSPVYLWRRGVLTKLSQAHTHPERQMQHVLTRAIGLEATVEPFAFETVIENGDVVLLCSDGVGTTIAEDKIAAALERRSTARSLVSTAREIAEQNEELADDASAIVIDIVERGPDHSTTRRNLEVLTDLRAGTEVDGYRLVRSLQAGDRVWLAEARNGARHVLKFPSMEARDDDVRRDAFVREAWRAARIDSRDFPLAIAPPEGPLRYYAMDYIEAPTLREVLATGPLRVEEAVSLATFLLRACQFLLTRDFVHGDIKPENILVQRTPQQIEFKLLDLGSVAEVFSVTSRAGTPSYLAPERFAGSPLSERTEIFAIGVTLFESLTRSFPYGEIERFQTPRFDPSLRRVIRLNPAVPPWLETVLQRALIPEPALRYQTYSEMAFDVEHPAAVEPFHRKDAPLLERNPLLFYKVLCGILVISNLALLAYLAGK